MEGLLRGVEVFVRDPIFLGVVCNVMYVADTTLHRFLGTVPANLIITLMHGGDRPTGVIRDWCIANSRAYHMVFCGNAYVSFANDEEVAAEALVRLADEVVFFGWPAPDKRYAHVLNKARMWGKVGGVYGSKDSPVYKTG